MTVCLICPSDGVEACPGCPCLSYSDCWTWTLAPRDPVKKMNGLWKVRNRGLHHLHPSCFTGFSALNLKPDLNEYRWLTDICRTWKGNSVPESGKQVKHSGQRPVGLEKPVLKYLRWWWKLIPFQLNSPFTRLSSLYLKLFLSAEKNECTNTQTHTNVETSLTSQFFKVDCFLCFLEFWLLREVKHGNELSLNAAARSHSLVRRLNDIEVIQKINVKSNKEESTGNVRPVI